MEKKKKIKYTIFLVIVIILVIWMSSRWSVWFGNPDEPAYEVPNEPTRIVLTMGNSGQYSRSVSWRCGSALANGVVDLLREGTSDTIQVQAIGKLCKSRSGVSAVYDAFMDFLTPGAVYRYRVRNDSLASCWFRFFTHDENRKDEMSFLYFGDVQDGDSNAVTKQLFRDVFAQNGETDFALFGGDFIERPMDKYWEMAFESLDTVASTLPVLAVPGNHEYLKGLVRKLDSRYDYVFPYYLNSKARENHVFTFPFGNVRFYFLDSNRDFWNYYAQRSWLKKELEKSSEKWNVVVLHHPIYSLKGSMNGLLVRWAFKSVIEKGNVDLVLQGHEHGYGRRSTKDGAGKDKTPVYLVSYFSEKAYPLTFAGDYDRWGSYYRYYQKISVHGDSLNLRTYTAEGMLYDDVLLLKNGEETQVIDRAKKIPQKVDISVNYRKQKGDVRADKAQALIDEWKESKGMK